MEKRCSNCTYWAGLKCHQPAKVSTKLDKVPFGMPAMGGTRCNEFKSYAEKVKPEVNNCGTCRKFRGGRERCDEGLQPQDETDGCNNSRRAWEPKQQPVTLGLFQEMNCGSCDHFKGAKVSCGQSAYVPQSSTDGCSGRHFKAKVVVEKGCWTCSNRRQDDVADICGVSGHSIQNSDGKICSSYTALRDNRSFAIKVSEISPLEMSALQEVQRNPGTKLGDVIARKLSVPNEEHSFIKFDDVGPRGSMSKDAFDTFGSGIKSFYYTHSLKKESINMNAIIRLADSQLNKDMEEFGALPIDIRTALVTMQEEAKKNAATSAAKEVMQLLENTNKQVEVKVTSIRSYRKLIDSTKTELETIARAKAYGLETSNFIPLSILAGQIRIGDLDNKDLGKVPEDWAPAGTKLPVASAPEDKSA